MIFFYRCISDIAIDDDSFFVFTKKLIFPIVLIDVETWCLQFSRISYFVMRNINFRLLVSRMKAQMLRNFTNEEVSIYPFARKHRSPKRERQRAVNHETNAMFREWNKNSEIKNILIPTIKIVLILKRKYAIIDRLIILNKIYAAILHIWINTRKSLSRRNCIINKFPLFLVFGYSGNLY